MARLSLPPGFRFHPTDVELIKYYLKRKSLGKKLRFDAIAEVNIYKYSPWDLPDFSCLKNKDLEWFFFCPISRKYASGSRFGRATETGYWKATGKDRPVLHNEETVGLIKTLVFHQGQAPKGERTDWVMHEYRIMEKELADAGINQAPYVLVKVFKKSGLGPKNGAQYGAPFNEQEWDIDDNDEMEISAETFQPPAAIPPSTVANNTCVYAGTSSASLQAPDNSPLSALTHNNSINQNYDCSLDTTTQSASLLLPAHDNNSITHNDSYSLDTTTPSANLLPTAHNNSSGTCNESYSTDTLPPLTAHNNSSGTCNESYSIDTIPPLTAHNNSSGTCNDNYSFDTLTLPQTGQSNSTITTATPTVPLLPLPGPSTIMAWANGVAPGVEEVDIDSFLAMFSEDEFPNMPSYFNDVNQVNGEEFIELDDIYADLDDLNDWEKLQRGCFDDKQNF